MGFAQKKKKKITKGEVQVLKMGRDIYILTLLVDFLFYVFFPFLLGRRIFPYILFSPHLIFV